MCYYGHMNSSLFTDEQWNRIGNELSMPVPLHTANLDLPFVYDRKWGVFYVSMGYHQIAMATLLTFRAGYADPYEYGRRILKLEGYSFLNEMADKYLMETEGTCFASSLEPDMIIVGKRGHLNAGEKMALRNYPLRYIEDRY